MILQAGICFIDMRQGLGLGIKHPENIVPVGAALRAIGTGQIQLAAGLIVSQGGVAVNPRTATREARARQGQSAVLDVIQRPGIKIQN